MSRLIIDIAMYLHYLVYPVGLSDSIDIVVYCTSSFFTGQYFHKFHENSSGSWKYNHE